MCHCAQHTALHAARVLVFHIFHPVTLTASPRCKFFFTPPASRALSPVHTHRSFATTTFQNQSLQHANHVLHPSAMGKSRSATCVIAYLMQKHNITPSEALSHIRQARSICEPNDGFMAQLELYGRMNAPQGVEESPAYQRWVYLREVELSRACSQAPEAEKIRFEDEHVAGQSADFELRCRKCR